MRYLMKVPVMALIGGLTLAACGGDAESAADLESERLEELIEAEVEERVEERIAERLGTVPEADAPPASHAPPARAPAAPPSEVAPVRETPPVTPDPVIEEAEPAPAPIAIPAGARVSTVVQSTLSTRTHEVGDLFEVKVSEPVLAADGAVLVGEGATLEGRIVEARRSSGPDEEAVMVVTFETLVSEGKRFPIRSTVVETELESEAGDSGARSAAKVATGAAAGAIIGQILGRDTRSTVQGAAAGAVAGAGVALTTRDGHAVLREGSRLVVQLDHPVVLVASGG